MHNPGVRLVSRSVYQYVSGVHHCCRTGSRGPLRISDCYENPKAIGEQGYWYTLSEDREASSSELPSDSEASVVSPLPSHLTFLFSGRLDRMEDSESSPSPLSPGSKCFRFTILW